LLVTEPLLDLPILQSSYDQIVFEEYEFNSYLRTTGTKSSANAFAGVGSLAFGGCGELIVSTGVGAVA